MKKLSKKFREKRRRRLIPIPEARRHYALEKLPQELQLQVVEKLRDGETYERIREFLAEKKVSVTLASLSRYFHGRVKPEFEQVKDLILKRRMLYDDLIKLWKNSPDQQPPEIIKQLLICGIIANETPMTEVSPARLLAEQTKRAKLELEQARLQLMKERLDLIREKIKSGELEIGAIAEGGVQIYLPDNRRPAAESRG